MLGTLLVGLLALALAVFGCALVSPVAEIPGR